MTDSLVIRPIQPSDVKVLLTLIRALAEYEKLSHLVVATEEALTKHLFAEPRYAEAIAADWEGEMVGFALFFPNYSTFLAKPGIYLEDLFVLPAYRQKGIGKALLNYLIQLAQVRGAGRLEWSVLDWNQPAIGFYQKMGAEVLPDWRICRIIL
ncbi:MAG: GNAT family N-acetyltransferase [Microcystaceae cyanobacterium]